MARAQTIVAPNSLATVEGGFFNRVPFMVNGGAHYQQVYNASQFSAISGPTQITQIAFWPDATFGGVFSRTLSNVTFRLSTTSAAADGLDPNFANNLGADVTTVRSGAITLSSSFTGAGAGPKNFDILVNFSTPFTYNPANGNLLLDVHNQSPENNNNGVAFDMEGTLGDSISRVSGTEGTPGAATGTVGSAGFVTQFTLVALPEPGTLVFLALGGTLVIVARRRRYP